MAHALKKIILGVAVLALSSAPIAARADFTADARAEAKKHYDRAMELNEDGQTAEAVIELKRAYELAPHHTVLYNLGQAYITLAKPVEAVAALQRYLDDGGKAIKPARRAEVEREIARQKTRIASLEIRGLPDGARIRVNGVDVGAAPLSKPIPVGIGDHVVSASAEGHDPAEIHVTVAGEDRKTVELILKAHPEKKADVQPAGVAEPRPTPVPTPPSPVAAEPPFIPRPTAAWLPPDLVSRPAPSSSDLVTQTASPPPYEKPYSALRITGWAGLGLGIAGLGLGAVTGIVASSENDDLAKKCPSRTCGTYLQGDVDRYNNLKLASTVGLVAGGACVVAGVILLWVGSSADHPDSSSVALNIGPRSASVQVPF